MADGPQSVIGLLDWDICRRNVSDITSLAQGKVCKTTDPHGIVAAAWVLLETSDGRQWHANQDLNGRAVFREVPIGGRVGCVQQLGRLRCRRRRGAERASEEVGGASRVAAESELRRICQIFRRVTFATAWCHFFLVWQDSGADTDYRFSEEDLRPFDPSPEWSSFVAACCWPSDAHSGTNH